MADDLSSLLVQLSSLDEDGDAARQSQLLQTLRHRHLSSSSQRQDLSTEQTHEIIDALITSMGTHLSHADVQTQCLVALSKLAYDAESNRDYLVSRGALTLAGEAMKNHLKDGSVQADACALLTNVCAVNATDIRTKAGQELGMISLVVAALQEHRGDDKVARYGCAALGSLAVDDAANCATMGELGAVEVLLDVLGRYGGGRGVGAGGHDQDEDEETAIIDRALAALNNITITDKNNRNRLAQRHGSVATIIAAIRGHETNERITKHGLALVRRLVENSTPCATDVLGVAVPPSSWRRWNLTRTTGPSRRRGWRFFAGWSALTRGGSSWVWPARLSGRYGPWPPWQAIANYSFRLRRHCTISRLIARRTAIGSVPPGGSVRY